MNRRACKAALLAMDFNSPEEMAKEKEKIKIQAETDLMREGDE